MQILSKLVTFFYVKKIGFVHVCDHTCQETVVDAANQLLICLISGRCSDKWISTTEEEVNPGYQQADYVAADEAVPLTGDGQLGALFGSSIPYSPQFVAKSKIILVSPCCCLGLLHSH